MFDFEFLTNVSMNVIPVKPGLCCMCNEVKTELKVSKIMIQRKLFIKITM